MRLTTQLTDDLLVRLNEVLETALLVPLSPFRILNRVLHCPREPYPLTTLQLLVHLLLQTLDESLVVFQKVGALLFCVVQTCVAMTRGNL